MMMDPGLLHLLKIWLDHCVSAAEFVASSLLDWGSVIHDVAACRPRTWGPGWLPMAAAVVVRLATELIWLGQVRGLLVEAT